MENTSALPTARERAQAALSLRVNGELPEEIVTAVAAAIDLAVEDETRACAKIAADLATRLTLDGRHGAGFEMAAAIGARILERAKRWPDEGATT
jgi:hypothetical protein